MSRDDLSAVLMIGMNSDEMRKFNRLKDRIFAMLRANGGRTIALCGVSDQGGVRTIELFGRVRITAEAFVNGSDSEVLEWIGLIDLKVRGSTTEDTSGMNRLSE